MWLNYTQLRMVLISVLEVDRSREREGAHAVWQDDFIFYVPLFLPATGKEHDFQGLCSSILVNVNSINVLEEVINLILISNFLPRACFTGPLTAIKP